MATESIRIDIDSAFREARLVFLARKLGGESVPGGLEFLHRVRFMRNDPVYAASHAAHAYYQQLAKHTATLVREVGDAEFDLILSPPSRRLDAEPYRAALRMRFPDAKDLTGSLERTGSVSAGETRDAAALLSALSISTSCDLRSATSLLVVDDVYSSGTTVAAVVALLTSRGLPQNATVTIAAPLYAGPQRA